MGNVSTCQDRNYPGEWPHVLGGRVNETTGMPLMAGSRLSRACDGCDVTYV